MRREKQLVDIRNMTAAEAEALNPMSTPPEAHLQLNTWKSLSNRRKQVSSKLSEFELNYW